MSELDGIEIGDWIVVVSTSNGATAPLLQQVLSTTVGLVKTKNYTFRRDGRAFYNHHQNMIARRASDAEITQWARRAQAELPEVILARYLTKVSKDEWATLGLPQLKKIKAALEKSQAD